jgi:hypothetical protein
VGRQFVPDYLHHPVFRYRTPRVIRAFVPRTAGFLQIAPVSASVSARQKGGFDLLSLHRKIPFPARGGERFYDWLVGHQFVPAAVIPD